MQTHFFFNLICVLLLFLLLILALPPYRRYIVYFLCTGAIVMAFSCRFRSIIQTQQMIRNNFFRNFSASHTRIVSVKATPVQQPSLESHDQRNARLRRPQSPHLTIYKPQLTSILSISHRGTGLALGGLMIAWGFGALALPYTFPEYLAAIQTWSPASIVALKTFIAFPLSYHYCNGIRHLMWDLGRFLTIKEVYTTGYLMLLSATVLTGILVSL